MTSTDPATWQRWLPNALTLGRVALGVVFFVLLAVWRPGGATSGIDAWLLAAMGLFVAAAVTDALDGYLARRWGVVSLFGRIMDPFADKVLVIGAFVMLCGGEFAGRTGIAAWMAVVILARELLVTSIRGAYESRGVDFSATTSGKLKMVLQCVCVPVVLLALAVRPTAGDGSAWLDPIAKWTVWATVGVTAWSGLPYVMRAVRQSARMQG